MWEDPIVEEAHRAREKLAAACNYDLGAFFAGVRERQASLGNMLVRQSPARSTTEADRDGPSGSSRAESSGANSYHK
jgi:hypothetical protein